MRLGDGCSPNLKLWKGVLGRHRIDNCNDSGRLLLEFCSEHQLVITNTLFQQKNRFKATWRHPCSKHLHCLDYVLTLQHDPRDVLHTRVMPSADCYTDHRLVCCKVAFAFKSPPKRKGLQTKKLCVHKLCDPRVKNNLQVTLEERLHCVTAAEPEEQWKQMKTILRETTAEAVGLSTRKHQDWFDKQIRKSKSCLKRKAPATIMCLQNLIIKLPRLHTRLPAAHSRLNLGPCRMIGGQDLPRGHNGMLTWVTCTPSTRH